MRSIRETAFGVGGVTIPLELDRSQLFVDLNVIEPRSIFRAETLVRKFSLPYYWIRNVNV